jgi:hypothetical protein
LALKNSQYAIMPMARCPGLDHFGLALNRAAKTDPSLLSLMPLFSDAVLSKTPIDLTRADELNAWTMSVSEKNFRHRGLSASGGHRGGKTSVVKIFLFSRVCNWAVIGRPFRNQKNCGIFSDAAEWVSSG